MSQASGTRARVWLVGLVGVGLLGLGVWLVVANLPNLLTGQPPESPQARPTPSDGTGDPRTISATLFFLAENGRELEPVSQDVLFSASTAGQARRIVEALLQTPPDDRRSAIPAGTELRALYLTARGEAFVDLSSEIVSGHPGGSLNEALTVYTIVNALAVNLPEVSGVQILVEGVEVDTLNGHLDLRHPLSRSLRWIQRGQQLP